MSTGKIKKSSLVGSASVVSSATGFSRILGLVREQVMAYFFGASMATDAFVAAYRIPNLLRDMFAEGALSSAFVPIFKEKLVKEGEEEAFSLARTVATAIFLVVGGLVLLGIVAAPVLIYISANGFTESPEKFTLTVDLTRIMFVYLLLVSLSALVMGMLNSFGRFGIPAISPALFNLGTIGGVLLLHNYFEIPIYSLAVGVIIGGMGQLLIQLPALWRVGFAFKPQFRFLDEGLRRVMRLFVPMVIGLSASRINILLSTLLASFLIEGSLSYLNYSYRLMHFPLGVFAVALGTVALPKAADLVARGDMKGLGQTFSQAINWNMFLVLPSAAILALMGHDIIEVIFARGAFDELATDRTALALLHYSYGLVGFAAVRVTVPIFYALGDSKLPMRLSLLTVFVNMALYYPLIQILDFAGLAAATSVAGLLNFALLIWALPSKRVPVKMGSLILGFVRMGMAAMLAVFFARMIPFGLDGVSAGIWSKMLGLILTLLAAATLYLLFCYLLRVPLVVRWTKRRVDSEQSGG